LPPDGTWQVDLTAADFQAAGLPADAAAPGTYRWTFEDGRASIELDADDGSGAYCEADMVLLDGSNFRLDYDPAGGDCGDEVDQISWTLEDDGLHLMIVASTAGLEEQRAYLETKPWQQVDPVASTEVPGFVDVGGRELFMECRGSGSPTVIFLAGTRVPRGAMRGIQDELLRGAVPVRVCDYDRAGEGRSDPAPEPQDDLDVVDDLATLLAEAGIEPPYVLVGHSLGGDQTWLYADRHPEGVAGFLMMNAGAFEYDWDALHDIWSQAEIDEERAYSESGLGSVKQAATPPDGVPYVVMMSTIAQCFSTTDVCGRIYPFYEAWAQELADRTGSGRFVSIEAGHEIYQTQLPRVVEEINLLLDEVRSTPSPIPSASATAAAVALQGSIVFGREDGPDHWQVWISCADLSQPRQLTHGDGQQSGWPDFSPHGTRIAFNSDRHDPDLADGIDVWDIYTMDVEGGDITKLTASTGSSVDPAYSSDGSLITYGWDAPGEEGIYVMDAADGGNVRRITNRPADATWDYSPHFAPDGTRLVFSRDFGEAGSALFVVNLDGSGLTRITPAGVVAGEGNWSPDGTQIAFDGELGRGMWVVAPDGTDLTNLSPAPPTPGIQHGFSDPIWALDGALLLVQHGLHYDDGTVTVGMAVMKPDGSDLHYVGDGTGAEEKGDWSATAC
jgi:pimeloyl-ACP methyl ester carboxylesterase